ncbi:MAG: PEGA domain-containing protein [Planctomycetota bacterium]|nr:PEGA domain-containing protein [Planctomycetota bacterium]
MVGCRTKRTLIVDSVPEGALVRLDEEVIGTTPLRHEFTHGGRRRVSIYHPGHRTWSQVVDLEMPWYARFPMDVLTEVILPLGIDHEFAFEVPLVRDTLEESSDAPAIEGYLTRARALWAAERGSLEAKPQASDGQ